MGHTLHIYFPYVYLFPCHIFKQVYIAWENVVLNRQRNNLIFIGKDNTSLKQELYMVFV